MVMAFLTIFRRCVANARFFIVLNYQASVRICPAKLIRGAMARF
jgi:hypothetical protein